MSEQLYTVVVTVNHPTEWQSTSEAAYGPMSENEMNAFTDFLVKQVGSSEYTVTVDSKKVHLLELDSTLQRIAVYPLYRWPA